MARCQVDQLDTPIGKKGICTDEERIGPLARKRREGRIDLSAGAGVGRPGFAARWRAQPVRASRNVISAVRLAGLTSTATRAAAGTSSRKSSSRFATNSPTKN